jgi:hypothetical protein
MTVKAQDRRVGKEELSGVTGVRSVTGSTHPSGNGGMHVFALEFFLVVTTVTETRGLRNEEFCIF